MKKFKFTISGNEYAVNVKSVEDNIAKLEVNGTPYKIELQQEIKASKTPVLVRKEVQTKQGDDRVKENLSPIAASKKPSSKTVKSPLPGSVLKVNVAEGDSFNEGDVLMVMESMKMENNILAERNGKVLRVIAPAGTAVLQDEDLFEIE